MYGWMTVISNSVSRLSIRLSLLLFVLAFSISYRYKANCFMSASRLLASISLCMAYVLKVLYTSRNAGIWVVLEVR